jgi:hypothetical protein
LNDAQTAGDAAPLELRIDAKSFLSAARGSMSFATWSFGSMRDRSVP